MEQKATNPTKPAEKASTQPPKPGPQAGSDQAPSGKDAGHSTKEAGQKNAEGPAANKEHEALNAKIVELTNLLQYVQADYVNFKNRVTRDQQVVVQDSNKKIITDLLSVLDVFDIALGSLKEHNEMSRGFEMVHAQLLDLLKRHGLSVIGSIGALADLHSYEVVRKAQSKEKPNHVIEIIQKGYKLHDRVLRPAKVVVSCQDPANTQ